MKFTYLHVVNSLLPSVALPRCLSFALDVYILAPNLRATHSCNSIIHRYSDSCLYHGNAYLELVVHMSGKRSFYNVCSNGPLTRLAFHSILLCKSISRVNERSHRMSIPQPHNPIVPLLQKPEGLFIGSW